MKGESQQLPVRTKATVVSPGIALGNLVLILDQKRSQSSSGTDQRPQQEAFVEALAVAAEKLSGIIESLDDEEATGMVEFQLAMIEDDALQQPVIDKIEAGETAINAWQGVLDSEIADYQRAEDEYFRARAVDLRDIRDRVSTIIAGGAEQEFPQNSIVVGEELTPTQLLSTNWGSGGIALTGGSSNGHVAMLARSRAIPMVIGLESCPQDEGDASVLDAERGELVTGVDPNKLASYEQRRDRIIQRRRAEQVYLAKDAALSDGSPVSVMINLADPGECADVDPAHCNGVGLVRTEFLFHGKQSLPDEDQQFEAYKNIVEWAAGNPVTIRTLDAGGDKPVSGLTVLTESNPFLGLRGVRLSLRYVDVFAVQLRALLRAAACGPLKIMLPMVTVPEEVERVRELIGRQKRLLDSRRVKYGEPSIGIMVEVPSAALCVDQFDVDFYSIGSNDLIQYVTACSRDSTELQGLSRPDNPAVTRLIGEIISFGRSVGREVSLCGEMAADPAHIGTLLKLGLSTFSVSPGALARTKAAIIESGL